MQFNPKWGVEEESGTSCHLTSYPLLSKSFLLSLKVLKVLILVVHWVRILLCLILSPVFIETYLVIRGLTFLI